MWKNVILVFVLCLILASYTQAYTTEYERNGEVYLLIGDRDRDGYNDLFDIGLLVSAWLEQDCGLTNSCDGTDIYPECGDGEVTFGDFAAIAGVFGQCTDPTNPDCVHLPLTLYEPPRKSGWKNKAKGLIGRAKSSDVRPFSGEFQIAEADLVIPGRGLDFRWARTYRSRTGSDTAMGNGWDFSYNIYLKSCSGNLIVHDGTGRKDTYYPQANGTWTADGFFGELELQSGNSFFTLTFPDTSTWQFLAFDDTNAPGKIDAIIDRNGNSLNFEYDAQGRLTTIRDPLDTGSNGRVITIGYDSNDLIVDVNDWAGRHIQYEYYNDGDANGSAGDLKSVTSPAVTGTPTGNDFPSGKTTTYTYSKGFADEEINHNLLTITDPNGQTYLQNFYGTDIADPNYDRVTRVTRPVSNPNAVISLTEGSQTPNAGNNYAVTRVVVNDRVGNVAEYFYDNRNRLVIERNYSGRAPDSNAPTSIDPNINIPVNPLRAGDPVFFETRYQYNKDSLPTRMDFANGNYVTNIYELDLDPNAVTRSRGNLREMHRFAGSLQAVSDQNEIVELFVYDPNFNFITRHIDPRGNETLYDYASNGNRIRTTNVIPGLEPNIVHEWQYNGFGQVTDHNLPDNGSRSKRRDEYTYYTNLSDPNYGYLKEASVDADNLALTTSYEYDAVGNVTRLIDPNSNDTQYIYNQLNQVVRSLSRVVDGNSLRYQSDTFYDVKDNVVRLEVLDINDGGILQSDPNITTTYEYDILNRLIRTTAEVDEGNSVVVEYEYDDNRNRTLTRFGEATNGNEPNNVIRTLYDERGLIFQVIRAESDPDQSTTQYDYDGNANITRVHKGLESIPYTTTSQFDGHDRLIQTNDPMGNIADFHYDSAGNLISKRIDGELTDVLGDVNNVRLSELNYEYDTINRLTHLTVAFFDPNDPNTQLLIDDGNVITEYQYSDNSQLIRKVDDNNNVTHFEYDTVNRKSLVIDPRGNTTNYTYDKKSNVISVTEVEKSDLPDPNETFVTTYTYDNLDRLVSVTDNNSNTTEYGYDSRNNRTRSTDALGNEVRHEYDARNRLIKTIRDMDGDGADANDVNDMVTTKKYDDNSRIIERTDDNGNTTAYEYDALNRLVKTTYADDTNETRTYDVYDDMVGYADAVGTTGVMAYDKMHRLTRGTHSAGAGVAPDPNFEEFKYDGLSRMVYAENNNSVITRAYDSLSNTVGETLNGKTITYTYDGLGNALSCTYPGGRVVTYTYDELNRRKNIFADSNSVADYDYIGPGRVRRLSYNNGIRNDYSYDDLKRITGTKHSVGVATVDDRSYSYDAMYNKIQRKDKRVGGEQLTHNYTYDPMYRLTATVVDDISLPPRTLRSTQYTLDGVGNRTNVIGSPTPNPGVYTLDANAPPADFQMNQYTTTSFDSREYDENGNLSTIDSSTTQKNIIYDYCNQIVEVNDVNTSQIHTYTYDALRRRIRKHTSGGGLPPAETLYFYDGARVIEEQDDIGTTLATYVYGNYIDEVLSMQRDSNDYYYHADDMYNVMAITDSNGIVVERYEYGDYGEPNFILSAGIGNPYLFNGRRYDDETGLYYYRTRYLDPKAGRFISRDSIGIWGDPANMGNGRAYVGNNPWTSTDPMGRGGGHPFNGLNVSKARYYPCGCENGSSCGGHCGGIAGPGGGHSGMMAQGTMKNSSTSAGGGGGGGSSVYRLRQHGQLLGYKLFESSGIAGGGGLHLLNTASVGNQGWSIGHEQNSSGSRTRIGELESKLQAIGFLTSTGGGHGHGGHITVLKIADYGHGHITVLKIADHGHITVLKIAGGGDHNGSITISAKKTTMAGGGGGGGDGGGNAKCHPGGDVGASRGNTFYCVFCTCGCRPSTTGCSGQNQNATRSGGGGGGSGHTPFHNKYRP